MNKIQEARTNGSQRFPLAVGGMNSKTRLLVFPQPQMYPSVALNQYAWVNSTPEHFVIYVSRPHANFEIDFEVNLHPPNIEYDKCICMQYTSRVEYRGEFSYRYIDTLPLIDISTETYLRTKQLFLNSWSDKLIHQCTLCVGMCIAWRSTQALVGNVPTPSV